MVELAKSLNGNVFKPVLFDERKAELIAQRYQLPFLVAQILSARNVDVEDVPSFLEPKIANLMPNPSVLKDVDVLAKRIAKAVVDKEKIAVIGDYDVDGATSSSLLRLFFEHFSLQPDIHIPDRNEGYGPSRQAVDDFVVKGATLLITTDCGTTAFDALEYAKQKGLDVLVIDHHEAEVNLPKIDAVVNPKRLDEQNDYPYLRFMSAVGVVFLSLVAVTRELRNLNVFMAMPEPPLMQWLDIVALGTVCDVVPLCGLNRAYVRQGLKIIAQRSNIGIRVLADKAGLSEPPTAFHLAYVLGPRINACGRVGDANFGNRLLCSKDLVEAQGLADKLQEFNDERRQIENYVLLQAIEMLESKPQQYPIAFVWGTDWHQGVIGIVAGKLKERYNVPAFVMSVEGGEVKGSARSIASIDLGALVMAAKEKGLLLSGGGHTMAAGFSLAEDKLEEFMDFVGQYVLNKIGSEAIVPEIEYDATLSLSGATVELADALRLLEPFGAGNSEPKFLLSDVNVIKPSIVGSGHIKSILTSPFGGSIKAMAFRAADTALGNAMLNSHGQTYEAIGVLRKDTWQGRNSVQFIIDDMREKQNG